MRNLEWKPRAVADLMAIVEYIADDNPEATQALKEDIEIRISGLRDNPWLYRAGRVAGTHEMVVHSNYVVVYAEDADTVRRNRRRKFDPAPQSRACANGALGSSRMASARAAPAQEFCKYLVTTTS